MHLVEGDFGGSRSFALTFLAVEADCLRHVKIAKTSNLSITVPGEIFHKLLYLNTLVGLIHYNIGSTIAIILGKQGYPAWDAPTDGYSNNAKIMLDSRLHAHLNVLGL